MVYDCTRLLIGISLCEIVNPSKKIYCALLSRNKNVLLLK